MKKAAIKKRATNRTRKAHRQGEVRTEVISEDKGVLCPDCREPMTEVVTHTFKWECRCSPGIHYCE